MSAAGLSVAPTNTTPSPGANPRDKAKGAAKAKSRPPEPAKSSAPRRVGAQGPAQNRSPKTRATRRPGSAIESKATPEPPTRIWTACYLFAGAGETAGMAIRRIRARDGETAREIALKSAPGEEFMLTMVPESDEQFLGQVRLKAMFAADHRS